MCLSTLRQALSRTWKEACNAYLDVCPEKRLADYDPRTGRWISLGCSSQATFFPKKMRGKRKVMRVNVWVNHAVSLFQIDSGTSTPAIRQYKRNL